MTLYQASCVPHAGLKSVFARLERKSFDLLMVLAAH